MTRLTLIFAVVIASLGLSACNTLKGVGQDMQKAGQSIENATKK
jgi:entericidin B